MRKLSRTQKVHGEVTLPTLACHVCEHKWLPRKAAPVFCPKCHSPKWNERKRAR